MTNKPLNHGRGWSAQDVEYLRKLVMLNTPVRLISNKLGRTENAVRNTASEFKISFRPWKKINA